MPNFIDMTGRKIFKWTVMRRGPNNKHGNTKWWCQCICGNQKLVDGRCLRIGGSKGCRDCIPTGNNHPLSTGYKDIPGWYISVLNCRSKSIKKRKLKVTPRQMWNKFKNQNGKCALSGLPLLFSANFNKNQQTASLDRIDSSKEYTIKNIQWIHKDIQSMKMDRNQKDFIALCKKIARTSR